MSKKEYGTRIQSVMFRATPTYIVTKDRHGEKKYKVDKRRRIFTRAEAVEWLKENNFVHEKIDATPNYYRFRQHTPRRGVRYRTIPLDDGVLAVVELPEQ